MQLTSTRWPVEASSTAARRAVLGIALAMTGGMLAVAAPAAQGAKKTTLPIPVETYVGYGKAACHVDTPSHRLRVWWSERNGARQAMPASDGRCATRPAAVAILLRNLDAILAREHALGLARPHSDRGVVSYDGFFFGYGASVVDGGSKAVDLYLDGHGGGNGQTLCQTTFGGGKMKSSAYITMGASGAFTAGWTQLNLLHIAAHELVHVAQCATTYPKRHRTATDLGRTIVEGTAESLAMAAMGQRSITDGFGTFPGQTDPIIPAGGLGFLEGAARETEPLLPLRESAVAATFGPYDNWAFWYALAGGANARPIVRLYNAAMRATKADKKSNYHTSIYRLFGETAVQRAALAEARFARFGGQLADLSLPPAPWKHLLETVDGGAEDLPVKFTLTPAVGTPAAAAVPLATARFAYAAVTWPAGSTTLQITASSPQGAARAAESVAVISPELASVAATAGTTWTLTRAAGGDAATVGIALANGRKAAETLTLAATAS